eukprot:SAG22_NODE_435_length_10524_cov_8.503789_6_plen_823_part_00
MPHLTLPAPAWSTYNLSKSTYMYTNVCVGPTPLGSPLRLLNVSTSWLSKWGLIEIDFDSREGEWTHHPGGKDSACLRKNQTQWPQIKSDDGDGRPGRRRVAVAATLGGGAGAGAGSVTELWVWPQRTDGLHEALDAAASAPVGSAITIHLLAGTHRLTRPLVLDARHAGTRLVGHGGASISGAVQIGGPPPPSRDGSRNVSSWAVAGKAECFGCSEIWRAAIPAGLDSRHVWVNGRRANRTWVGMPLLPLVGAKKTDAGTGFTVPGEQMLRWTHNASAVELVYRGAASAGSQWTESRCPVASIENHSRPLTRNVRGAPSGYRCVAGNCDEAACPKCCGQSGLMQKNESLDGGPGSRVCPPHLPICRGFLANKHWGSCYPDTSGPCCANYCDAAGCPPVGICGNGGLIQKDGHYGQGNRSAVCPKELPFCSNYEVNKHWGSCQLEPRYGNGSTLVTVAQPCANSGNAKGQQLNVPSYLENVFELLGDREAGHPGEFFLDAHAGYLYYVPHSDERRETTLAHLPTVDRLIEGQSATELMFDGLTFEHSTWMRPSTGEGFVEVQSGFCTVCRSCSCGGAPCVAANCTCVGAETPAALRFSRARGVVFSSCTFRHLGSNGISFNNGSTNNSVLHSRFEDISASAVAIGARSDPTTMPVAQRDINNTVADCTIAHVSAEYRGHPGLLVGFSHGTLIEHNELAFLPYTAISLGWGWSAYPHTFDGGNRILSNNIHHHMQILGDGGAIYTLGTQGGLPFSHIPNTSAVLPPSVRVCHTIMRATDPVKLMPLLEISCCNSLGFYGAGPGAQLDPRRRERALRSGRPRGDR